MKPYEISFKRGYDTLTTVTINNQAYDIYLRWISRDEAFEMKFGLQGQPPVCYAKLTTNANLISKCRYIDKMPQGILTVVDTMGDGRISYDEFGASLRFRLVYCE